MDNATECVLRNAPHMAIALTETLDHQSKDGIDWVGLVSMHRDRYIDGLIP